jgi:ABC-type lipoprotein export system ATPase subunit/ABC-type transporter Mla maintaining outer membrane lipid asymmetry permease subunit MlaE
MIILQNFAIDTVGTDEQGKTCAYPLIQNANLTSGESGIILLLGPSGSGKSLLINMLLGLVSPHIPELWLDHNSQFWFVADRRYDILGDLYPPQLQGKIGIMFQSLGLFDDLTVRENIAFANSQSLRPRPAKEFEMWLPNLFAANNLNLGPNMVHARLNILSGGQRQRVAFARLLAYRPEVRILDEPTAALDAASAQNVVRLIQSDQEAQLTIIITHDYERFLPIAQRVWFITSDQEQRRVIEDHCPPQPPDYYKQKLAQNLPNYSYDPTTARKNGQSYRQYRYKCLDIPWQTAHRRLYYGFRRAFQWSIYRWFGKFFFVLSRLLILRATPYVLFASFFLGLVATYFAFHTSFGKVPASEVEVSHIIRPLFFEQMLSGFSVALFRVLVPLLACIFIAARSGIAITAYLSSMRDTERRQWDAFRTFGVDPNTFFFPQVFICFVFGCALLAYLSFFSAALGCLMIAVYTNELCTWFTWLNSFWNNLEPAYFLGVIPYFRGFGMFLAKTMCAGAAIAVISFWWGTRAKKSSLDTLRYLIGANIWNMMAILVIFFILLLLDIHYFPL